MSKKNSVKIFNAGSETDYSRKINIIGDIDEAAYEKFIETLDGMEEILEGDAISIEIMSHGGDAQVALAFFDRIRRIKGAVSIRAFGAVSSAAVLVLAAGDIREMGSSSWVMVHEDVVVTDSDQPRVKEAVKAAVVGDMLERQWNKLLASRSKITSEAWSKLHQDETYLDAKKCLEIGLITRIL